MGHLGLFQIIKSTKNPLTSKNVTATGVCSGTFGDRGLKPEGTLCRVKWGKSSIKGHPYSPTLRFSPSSKAFNFATYQLSNNQTSLLSPPPFNQTNINMGGCSCTTCCSGTCSGSCSGCGSCTVSSLSSTPNS